MNPWATITICITGIMGIIGLALTPEAPLDPWEPAVSSTVYIPPTTEAPLATQDALIAPYEGPGCAEWADLALRAGFTPSDLPTALQVMELESMCLPDAIGDNGSSFGLMQINRFWCEPSRYWPNGYLQTFGMLDDCVELLDPLTNLTVAWHIAANHGWANWTTYDQLP